MEHEYFGHLRYFEYAKTGAKIWQGEIAPWDGSHPIGVTIDAGESGPTAAQVEFVQSLLRDPKVLAGRCHPMLQECFANWSESSETYSIDDFRLCGLSVPETGSQDGEWDVSYDMLFDPAEHMLTVYFKSGEIEGSSIDG